MKIKILRDIPGYKAGEIVETVKEDEIDHFNKYSYRFYFLIEEGFAEEVKDDIDIEAVRKECAIDYERKGGTHVKMVASGSYLPEDARFLTAYRTVKAVIDQLNDGWKPEIDREYHLDFISYDRLLKGFRMNFCRKDHVSVVPYVRDHVVGQKVIELCEPELKVLFGVK